MSWIYPLHLVCNTHVNAAGAACERTAIHKAWAMVVSYHKALTGYGAELDGCGLMMTDHLSMPALRSRA